MAFCTGEQQWGYCCAELDVCSEWLQHGLILFQFCPRCFAVVLLIGLFPKLGFCCSLSTGGNSNFPSQIII